MGSLERYHQKRDPASTPEPFGDGRLRRILPPAAAREFVIQQHAARNLHWDLRLEIDDVLVSWAVPKGPTLDPSQRRLAVQTEDHPIEYAGFEGLIPEGNYGAGAMIVWDHGSFRSADGVTPSEGLKAGKLDLWLSGLKVQGRFALVRTKAGEGRHWLLFHKGRTQAGDTELIDEHPESVLSGLTIEQVAERRSFDASVAKRLADAPNRAAASIAKLKPMLAASADKAFSREGWLFELKYDGMRVLVEKRANGEVELRSRRGRDATHSFPEIAAAARHLPVRQFILDGEIVALDDTGRSSFERLQPRFGKTDPERVARLRIEVPTVLFAFDLLAVAGRDLRARPLRERKQILAQFAPRLGRIRFTDHVETAGEALYEIACEHELEGIIAKRADARYEAGRRSRSWLKIKAPRRAELAIVGYAEGRGSRAALGSLLLGWTRAGEFRYAGNVGSGIDGATADELLPRLRAATRPTAACSGTPTSPARATHYVEPEFVCAVRYTEVTRGGSLRHPVFAGLVDDRDPRDCEAPRERESIAEGIELAPVAAAEPTLALSNLDKVFWPDEGYTKGDLIGYYEAVWPWLEPYLRDRPVVLTRYPDGIDGKFFYQKNAPEFTPAWVKRENIEGTDYFICNDRLTLSYVINSGAIPLHVWGARLDSLDRPDWLVIDLDPKQAPFSSVVEIARHIHALLTELETAHFVKTSGQSGLHILLPMGGQLDHEQTRALAEVLARSVCAELPEIATIVRPIAARGDKVYVDFGQNGRGRLIASPLSVRPVAGATVSMPLRWTQVTQRLNLAKWTLKNTPAWLAKHGDPLLGVLGDPVDVERLLTALSARLAQASDPA